MSDPADAPKIWPDARHLEGGTDEVGSSLWTCLANSDRALGLLVDLTATGIARLKTALAEKESFSGTLVIALSPACPTRTSRHAVCPPSCLLLQSSSSQQSWLWLGGNGDLDEHRPYYPASLNLLLPVSGLTVNLWCRQFDSIAGEVRLKIPAIRVGIGLQFDRPTHDDTTQALIDALDFNEN